MKTIRLIFAVGSMTLLMTCNAGQYVQQQWQSQSPFNKFLGMSSLTCGGLALGSYYLQGRKTPFARILATASAVSLGVLFYRNIMRQYYIKDKKQKPSSIVTGTIAIGTYVALFDDIPASIRERFDSLQYKCCATKSFHYLSSSTLKASHLVAVATQNNSSNALNNMCPQHSDVLGLSNECSPVTYLPLFVFDGYKPGDDLLFKYDSWTIRLRLSNDVAFGTPDLKEKYPKHLHTYSAMMCSLKAMCVTRK